MQAGNFNPVARLFCAPVQFPTGMIGRDDLS
jgi:hypothetical protein